MVKIEEKYITSPPSTPLWPFETKAFNAKINLTKHGIVQKNSQGGYFERGKSFSSVSWVYIVDAYQVKLKMAGKCSVERLVKLT